MKSKRAILAIPMAVLVLAAAAQGQFARPPSISGIWSPRVGSASLYKVIGESGKKMTMELAVVGTERIAGAPGHWMETVMTDPAQGTTVFKMLLSMGGGGGATPGPKRMIMQMGDMDPMEMSMNMMSQMGNNQSESSDIRATSDLIGTESVTVPAGTFTCQHYKAKNGSAEYWISEAVSPYGLVKSTGRKGSWTLLKQTDAYRSKITKTPVPFDPALMMQMGKRP